MWIKSKNIAALHGFSTRQGGVSAGPFESLNLGGHDDDPHLVEQNRLIALDSLKLERKNLSLLKQVHGCAVVSAGAEIAMADAQVSNQKGKTLVVQVADCYPILYHDPVNHVIGAAHAGWRGTVARIAGNTVKEMIHLGADEKHIQVAIGPGICQEHFEVGEEVVTEFMEKGFPSSIVNGRYIDLVAANRFVLEEAGVPSENITSIGRCTFEKDFFSYRRDKGLTGRMWGLISMSTL